MIEPVFKRSVAFLAALILAVSLAGNADAAKKKKRKKAPAKAVAAKPEPPAWANMVRDGDGGRICFAAAEPTRKSPGSYAHGEVFFMVATWKSGAVREQPSLSVGYPLNAQFAPTAIVSSILNAPMRTQLYVDGQEAFVANSMQEQMLIASMRKGKTLTVEAVTQDGLRTTYDFSLSGISAALTAAARDCS